MMQKYFHFTITCDARRQIPKMILERLVDEYIWQSRECGAGSASVRERAKRIRELIEGEINRRNARREFDRIMSNRAREEELEQTS